MEIAMDDIAKPPRKRKKIVSQLKDQNSASNFGQSSSSSGKAEVDAKEGSRLCDEQMNLCPNTLTETQLNLSKVEDQSGCSDFLHSSLLGGGLEVDAKVATRFSDEQMCLWPNTLSEAQLDLLVCIKELAMERLTTVGEIGLEEILPASALQTIGIIMEELAKYWVRKQAFAPKDVEFVSSKVHKKTSSDHATL